MYKKIQKKSINLLYFYQVDSCITKLEVFILTDIIEKEKVDDKRTKKHFKAGSGSPEEDSQVVPKGIVTTFNTIINNKQVTSVVIKCLYYSSSTLRTL